MPKKPTKQPPKPPTRPLKDWIAPVENLYDKLITELEDRIAQGRIDGALLREFSSLMRAGAQLEASQAAQRRHDDRAAKSLSEPLVVRYLTLLADADWSHVRQSVESAREGRAGSVLA